MSSPAASSEPITNSTDTSCPDPAASAENAACDDPSSGAARSGSALCDWRSHARLWSVAILGLVLDLWSKEWAFSTLRQGGSRSLIPHVLSFETALNDGALFGIGSGQTLFFIVASLLALALVLWMFVQNPPQRRLLQLALGGILAGALGNMYDRVNVRLFPQWVTTETGTQIRRYFVAVDDDGQTMIIQEYPPVPDGSRSQLSGTAREKAAAASGYVRDFIKINTTFRGKELWPWVFNVADALLVVGVSILAIHLWTDRRHP